MRKMGGGVDWVKNRNGQWKGPGGGSSTGALCTRFTLVSKKFDYWIDIVKRRK
jgi:hypothetical protein